MPSDGDSPRVIVVVDEMISPRMIDRIVQELRGRVQRAIAIVKSAWKGLKDRALVSKLIEEFCAKGWSVIFITRDWHWKRSAKLHEQLEAARVKRNIVVVKVEDNIAQDDVWGARGAWIVGMVRQRLQTLVA